MTARPRHLMTARARELAAASGDTARVYTALWGVWFVNYNRGRYASAREMAEQLLALAEREGDTGRLLDFIGSPSSGGGQDALVNLGPSV